MKLLIVSDIHGSSEMLQELLQREKNAQGILVAGDLTHFGGRKQAAPLVDVLRSFSVPVAAIHGNCDRASVAELLSEEGLSAERDSLSLLDLPVVGLGGSLPAPIPTPSTYSEEDAAAVLGTLGNGLDGREWIFLVHQPPSKSEADRIASGRHVGSRSVADFIIKHRPSLVCTGHIHESFSVSRFADSLLVNPGSLKDGRYAVAELGPEEVTAELLRI
ncbi:metallophosphoesterase family protein [Marispirochaeta sp.]|jgi:uncharacterized protein|uniref:metallophosphoesterase family protein n=1 Tax=Marispirochaeta sp. TaxID=2038653 RepID=UPI0029C6C069|nr:metallophosphoesterase family protein [Marispirochaeta sp.]